MQINAIRDPDYLNFIKRDGTPPVNPTDAGTAGDIAYDSGYAYFCIATDTWLRVEIITWAAAVPGVGNPIGLLLVWTYAA